MPCHPTGEGWVCTGTEEGYAAMVMEQDAQERLTEPSFDRDGYPTDAALRTIAEWPSDDIRGWLAFCRACWSYPKYWREREHDDGLTVEFSTGGWSGNEDVVHAMQDNMLMWSLTWQSILRGGHYRLEVPTYLLRKAVPNG